MRLRLLLGRNNAWLGQIGFRLVKGIYLYAPGALVTQGRFRTAVFKIGFRFIELVLQVGSWVGGAVR